MPGRSIRLPLGRGADSHLRHCRLRSTHTPDRCCEPHKEGTGQDGPTAWHRRQQCLCTARSHHKDLNSTRSMERVRNSSGLVHVTSSLSGVLTLLSGKCLSPNKRHQSNWPRPALPLSPLSSTPPGIVQWGPSCVPACLRTRWEGSLGESSKTRMEGAFAQGWSMESHSGWSERRREGGSRN